MTATDNAIVISVFVICMAIGMIYLEEINTQHEIDTGRKYIEYDAVPFMNLTDLSDIGTTPGQFNSTVNTMTDIQPPSNIGFDFWFFYGINLVRFVANMLIYSTIGFPFFLVQFGLPFWAAPALVVVIGISYLLFIAYIITGKKF